jgi:uncharacterized protein (TIGR00730 family)
MRRICVFCGSSIGFRPRYVDAVKELGAEMVERGLGLVYGGATVGLMGILADTVLERSGHVMGVIPRHLVEREITHDRVTDLRLVDSMHERKATMAQEADAFIACPGGFGTFEEFCEVVTWSQLGLHAKPCGLLNVDGFFDPLLAQFDRAVHDGFVNQANRSLVLSAAGPAELLDVITVARPKYREKWIDSPLKA